MISGLVTTVASMPVDIAKTRIQNQKIVDGVPEYKGAVDVIKKVHFPSQVKIIIIFTLFKVVRNEGFFSLWKGFTPYYFRLGPHTVLTFIFLEQLNKLYITRVLGMDQSSGGSL